MANYGKCPACGKWVPKGDAQCPHCGATQGFSAWLAWLKHNLFPVSQERKSGSLCVACNKLVGVEDEACPHCGVKQTEFRKAAKAVADVLPSKLSATQGILGILGVLFVLPIVAMVGNPDADPMEYLLSGDSRVAINLGSMFGPFFAEGEWWRVVTAGYLHFGAVHLAFNGMGVSYVGRYCEELYGRGWYVFFYVFTGIVAFAVSYYGYGGEVNSAGASGPLFGLIGLGIGHLTRNRFENRQLLRTLIFWSLLSIVIGVAWRVDNWAHGGGFVAGFACSWIFPTERVTRGRAMNRIGDVLGTAAAILVAVCFALVVIQGRKFPVGM